MVGLGLELSALVVGTAVMMGRGFAAAAAGGPVSVPPSQYWDGNDGPWSTFALQLGTPPQNVRLLPSTSGSSIWAVLPEGCIAGDPTNCPSLRGFLFKPNSSSTWTDVGLFELTLFAERPLGYTGNADYGYDNATLGWQGNGGPTLEHQVVAGIATKDFSWLGMLGLTSHGTNFTDFNDPQPSPLMTLKKNGLVQSLSWGYTAGASYAPQGVYGSLTFGGYDAERFTPNNMTFPFGTDISWELLVGVQSITTTGSNSSDDSLLPSGIVALIDSTVPHIWLPVEACQRFEQTFGLVWDQKTGLYLVDEKLHSKLQAAAPNITFRLGIGASGGKTIDVVFPYRSFDLTVMLPGMNQSVPYFPLRRAANDSQYVLGRTFLQETYVIADYDRSSFSVSQAQFPDRAVSQKLVAILPPSNSSSTPNSTHASKHLLPTSAIIGVTVGAFTALLLPLLLVFHIRRRRRLLAPETATPPSRPSTPQAYGKPELDATTTVRHEAPAWRPVGEVQGRETEGVVFELPAEEAERAELAARASREKKGLVSEAAELATRTGKREKGEKQTTATTVAELPTKPKKDEKPVSVPRNPALGAPELSVRHAPKPSEDPPITTEVGNWPSSPPPSGFPKFI